MAIDQAAVEFEAKTGFQIYAVSFDAIMNDLPHLSIDELLQVPCHVYLNADHDMKKGALTHRWETDGQYEVSGLYFQSETHITVSKGQWRERRLELLTDVDKLKGWARDDNSNWVLLGNSDNVTEAEILHVDFQSEIQYEGTMNLPAVDVNSNRIVLNWVYTNQGWKRPGQCLNKRAGERQGTWARLVYLLTDPEDRFWFYFGIVV